MDGNTPVLSRATQCRLVADLITCQDQSNVLRIRRYRR